MAKDDRAKRIADEINSNPVLAAAVYGLGAAVLGAGLAAANSTPEKRRKFREMQVQHRRERAERERERVQSALRYRLEQSYFKEGPGKHLYDARAWLHFQAGPPLPDTLFERTGGTYGKHGFVASSAVAGAELSAYYAPYDGHGTCRLVRPDGSSREAEAGFGIDALLVYPGDDLAVWSEDARLMARLITAPGSYLTRIKLLRPDHARIRDDIWAEYLADNPHIASAIGDA
jgi:hypothetical protein